MRKLLCLLLLLLLIPTAYADGDIRYGRTDFTAAPDAGRIDFGNLRVYDVNTLTAFLDQLPKLTEVDMYATPVRRRTIELLHERYPQIRFGWTMQFAEHSVRTDATAFSTLHYGNAKVHGTADISLLRFCKNLRALDFGHNAVNDLSFVRELPELRVLICAVNRIDDLEPLADLPHLEYLEVFTNQITDITPLLACPHLMDLNLSYNYISDLSPLKQMTQLKRLWLYGAMDRRDNRTLPETVLHGLRVALPDTEIDAVHNPTGGTWREHPHFEVIHRMFRTGVYEPFEDSADTATGTDMHEEQKEIPDAATHGVWDF